MRFRRLLAACLVPLALVACQEAETDDPVAAGSALDEVAEPLLEAHAELERYDGLVDAGQHADAVSAWPSIESRVRSATERVDPDQPDLGSDERSTLRGYLGGLSISADAWSQVNTALGAGDEDAAAGAAAAARERMRHLARLRATAFPGE